MSAAAVRIDIVDTGAGIAAGTAEQIFEPFHTGKRGRLGLGLAICREIVQAHDGTLSAKHNQPRGTVFSLVLPAAGPL